MAEIPIFDLLHQVASETEDLMLHGTAAAMSSSSGTAPPIAYDADSQLPIPLQVLQHAMHHRLLLTVETTNGYAYQGTLLALDAYYNLTLGDVSVFRKRVPHVDFTQTAMGARGTAMGYLSSILVKSTHVVMVELPSELKGTYAHMARSVRRHLQLKARTTAATAAASPTPNTTTAAAAVKPNDDDVSGGATRQGRGRGGDGHRGAGGSRGRGDGGRGRGRGAGRGRGGAKQQQRDAVKKVLRRP